MPSLGGGNAETGRVRVGVGNTVQQWQQQPWPQQWPPAYYPGWNVVESREEYANAVEVSEDTHDVTLRFYRARGASKSLVKTVTVPRSLYDSLFKAKKK